MRTAWISQSQEPVTILPGNGLPLADPQSYKVNCGTGCFEKQGASHLCLLPYLIHSYLPTGLPLLLLAQYAFLLLVAVLGFVSGEAPPPYSLPVASVGLSVKVLWPALASSTGVGT